MIETRVIPKEGDLLVIKKRAGFFKKTIDSVDMNKEYVIQYEDYYVMYTRVRQDIATPVKGDTKHVWRKKRSFLLEDMILALTRLNENLDPSVGRRLFFNNEETIDDFSNIEWKNIQAFVGERHDS